MTGPARGRPLRLAFALLAAAIVGLDQLSKAWLLAVIPEPGGSFEVLGPYLRIVHWRNHGGLFGLLQGQAPVFAAFSLLVMVGIVIVHDRSGRAPMLTLTLGLLLGGALGNFIDRVRYGDVIDFVDAGIGSLRWFTFNVADAAISCAIVLLVAAAVFPSLADVGRGHSSDPGAPSGG